MAPRAGTQSRTIQTKINKRAAAEAAPATVQFTMSLPPCLNPPFPIRIYESFAVCKYLFGKTSAFHEITAGLTPD
jgi:hypothetical protein